jgi:hypothetical protein
MKKTERAVVCVAIVLLHAGLYFVLASTTHRAHIEPEPPALVLLPITLETPHDNPATPGHPRGQPSRSPVSHARQGAPASSPEPITNRPVAPPTDWAADAARAADDQVQAQITRERQARAFGPHGQALPGSAPPGPAFGWDQSAIHRFQPAGGGLTIVHVNEQCGIAFFLVVPFMGACALGKPEARGDLFKHMHDPPKMADWDDRKKLP